MSVNDDNNAHSYSYKLMTVSAKTFPNGTWILVTNFVLKSFIVCKTIFSVLFIYSISMSYYIHVLEGTINLKTNIG